MPFAGEPPDLWDPQVVAQDADHRSALGAMAAYVGAQYSAEEIWRFFRNYHEVFRPEEEAQLRPLAARIRAFDVPALREVTFTSHGFGDAAPSLYAVLTERLPHIAWDPLDALYASIEKYGLIHEVVEAPRDEATGDPMVLEVVGRLTHVNSQPVGSSWYRDLRYNDPAGVDEAAVNGKMTFRLERATYANTCTPGIGVPFYM